MMISPMSVACYGAVIKMSVPCNSARCGATAVTSVVSAVRGVLLLGPTQARLWNDNTPRCYKWMLLVEMVHKVNMSKAKSMRMSKL